MDVRIEGSYEGLLLRLARLNSEPTATGMVRALIRDAAKEVGLWPPVEAPAGDAGITPLTVNHNLQPDSQ